MATKTIIRGDDYNLARPFCEYAILNEAGQPMNLAGCIVMTTYRSAIQPIETDPFDANAIVKHHIQIAGDGSVTTASGLRLDTTAAAGVIIEGMTAAETQLFPLGVSCRSDVQITDANGEIVTYIMEDDVIAIDAYTNRTAIA